MPTQLAGRSRRPELALPPKVFRSSSERFMEVKAAAHLFSLAIF